MTKKAGKPILFNHRVYSCILIKNDIPYRWRGRYNEDTDLSLRVLKDGWCTVLFWAFLADKATTMSMKGGNTEELYKLDNADGRLLMAQSLQRQHPDVVKITHKWGRWQHQVDYRPFKGNKLIKKENLTIPEGDKMTDETAVNTAENKPKKATGKPFVKGDPRINRKGRPRSFQAFRELSQEVLHEEATDKDGKPIIINGHIATNAEMIVRSWLTDKKRQQALIEVAYGKVPAQVDITSGGEKIKAYIGWTPSEWLEDDKEEK